MFVCFLPTVLGKVDTAQAEKREALRLAVSYTARHVQCRLVPRLRCSEITRAKREEPVSVERERAMASRVVCTGRVERAPEEHAALRVLRRQHEHAPQIRGELRGGVVIVIAGEICGPGDDLVAFSQEAARPLRRVL